MHFELSHSCTEYPYVTPPTGALPFLWGQIARKWCNRAVVVQSFVVQSLTYKTRDHRTSPTAHQLISLAEEDLTLSEESRIPTQTFNERLSVMSVDCPQLSSQERGSRNQLYVGQRAVGNVSSLEVTISSSGSSNKDGQEPCR